jgi:hypothetical protein
MAMSHKKLAQKRAKHNLKRKAKSNNIIDRLHRVYNAIPDSQKTEMPVAPNLSDQTTLTL